MTVDVLVSIVSGLIFDSVSGSDTLCSLIVGVLLQCVALLNKKGILQIPVR